MGLSRRLKKSIIKPCKQPAILKDFREFRLQCKNTDLAKRLPLPILVVDGAPLSGKSTYTKKICDWFNKNVFNGSELQAFSVNYDHSFEPEDAIDFLDYFSEWFLGHYSMACGMSMDPECGMLVMDSGNSTMLHWLRYRSTNEDYALIAQWIAEFPVTNSMLATVTLTANTDKLLTRRKKIPPERALEIAKLNDSYIRSYQYAMSNGVPRLVDVGLLEGGIVKHTYWMANESPEPAVIDEKVEIICRMLARRMHELVTPLTLLDVRNTMPHPLIATDHMEFNKFSQQAGSYLVNDSENRLKN